MWILCQAHKQWWALWCPSAFAPSHAIYAAIWVSITQDKVSLLSPKIMRERERLRLRLKRGLSPRLRFRQKHRQRIRLRLRIRLRPRLKLRLRHRVRLILSLRLRLRRLKLTRGRNLFLWTLVSYAHFNTSHGLAQKFGFRYSRNKVANPRLFVGYVGTKCNSAGSYHEEMFDAITLRR
jgi:hypothetical protein